MSKLARGFRPATEIAYMEEAGLTREMLAALPAKLPRIPGGILVRLKDNGVIKKESRLRPFGALWKAGVNYHRVMQKWNAKSV